MPLDIDMAKPPHTEKSKIGRQFATACNSYDQASRLQRLTGDHLLQLSRPYLALLLNSPVLDLGCGTGVNTLKLADSHGRVFGCDLAWSMIEKTHRLGQSRPSESGSRQAPIQGIWADAEHLPFLADSFALVYSNLCLQWFDDLVKPLRQIAQVLKPQAPLLFSTLLEGTLTELKSAWAKLDDDNHVNQFMTLAQLETALQQAGFDYQISLQTVVLDYDNVSHLAKELKYLGANYVKQRQQQGLMGKEKWARLNASYLPFQQADGRYPASYQVAYVTAVTR